jgi:hypothetical protein
MAKPIPDEAPVTITTLFLILWPFSIFEPKPYAHR